MMRVLALAAVAATFLAPTPARANDLDRYRMDSETVALAAPCGALPEPEARRLRAALFDYYGMGSATRTGYPRIARPVLLTIQAGADARQPNGLRCLMAWRFMFEVTDSFPPGTKLRRPWTFDIWWQKNIHGRHKADVAAVTLALGCDLITADYAATLIERSAALPQVRFYLSFGQIADAHREGRAGAQRAVVPCPLVEAMLDAAEEGIAEDETGWVEPD